MRKEQKYSKAWFGVGILLAGNLAIWSGLLKNQDNFARVNFFDVGQGDSIYIRTVQGNDILIDGGPGDAVLAKLGRFLPYGDRKIELVILTHPHADHVSGLVEVLKRYQVDLVILPEVEYETATYSAFLKLLQEKSIKVARPRLGQRVFLDAYTVLDILYPIVGNFQKAPEDINDSSIVARLSVGASQVLLMGDAGKTVEQFLTAASLPLDAEILKVGHHGSRHSSSENFLQSVRPESAVISVGKNSYGHPHPDTLETLAQNHAAIFRTDQQGDVRFRIYPDKVLLNN